MADSVRDRVMFMSGGSRGIGLAIATRAARDGVRVALMAKTAEPHPRLPGTVYDGGGDRGRGRRGAPDRRRHPRRRGRSTPPSPRPSKFGGIDLVVNNASAINLAPMRDLEVKAST